MELDSEPKHTLSLAERLNQKIEADASEVVRVTQEKLNALADDSTQRLSDSLGTAISDIEGRLQRLRKLSLRTWIISLATAAVLTLGMLVGLSAYAYWRLDQVQALAVKKQALQNALKQLPPSFQMLQSGGKWYLVAPRIDYTPMTATVHGRKEDAVEIAR